MIRGGYGISFTPSTGTGRNPVPDFGLGGTIAWNNIRWAGTGAAPRTQTNNPEAVVSIGRNVPLLINDPTVLQIPADGKLCAGCTPADVRVPTTSLVAYARQNRQPYIQTWNLTLQRELFGRFVLTASYMGQKGTHLYLPPIPFNNPDPLGFDRLLDQGLDPDESVPDPFGRLDTAGNLRNVRRVDLLRPYPTIGDINLYRLTGANSSYHAGTFELDRRFQNGLGLRFNYSWTKALDNSSDANTDGDVFYSWGIGRMQNPLDLKANRSTSLFDQKHRFNWTANWSPRLGKNVLARNWSTGIIGSVVSGYPFAPFLNFANGVPNGQANTWLRVRPDIVPGVPLVNPRWNKSVANDAPYFNPEAFAIPAYGQLGNAARSLDYARLPWRQTLNVSVMRDFRPFKESRRYLQLRGEFFNVLNHVVFNTNANSSPGIFNSAPPVSRTGLSLAGPLPYLQGARAADYPLGSRENLIAAGYNQNFAKLIRDNNGPGRIVQLALKFYW
ncbi:MAG: hypothetical protein K2X03_03795 [Bryobacteraceae bacterium]|nr:hypothetical protein [Bryobacteraceae bacterium]